MSDTSPKVAAASERLPDPLKLSQLLAYLLPAAEDRDSVPIWPPDVYAVVASVLKRSGGYVHVVDEWPPVKDWPTSIAELGKEWRAAAITGADAPEQVRQWWASVLNASDKTIASIRGDHDLCVTLIQLSSAADEACRGVGVLDYEEGRDEFDDAALKLLASDDVSTLCKRVHPSRAIVLPKLHTPKSGLTVHSLTHNLSLCDPVDVKPLWHELALPDPRARHLNVLLLPLPYEVTPRSFTEVKGKITNLPATHKLFTYGADATAEYATVLEISRGAVAAAERLVGPVHVIVLPELALRVGDCQRLCSDLQRLVIAGEGRAADDASARAGSNAAVVATPLSPKPLATSWTQAKHHRWRMDGNQIVAYGLGATLDPTCESWEFIDIPQRQLHFWSQSGWLNFIVLICEDLARAEPVAELIRSIGPNLVIALLMDGPQISRRWSARYATVLADDPGSSVLTLTSAGMATLCRPPGTQPSRVVAMWKDAGHNVNEIEIAEGSAGIVLTLTREYVEEFSADGRSDRTGTGYVRLAGVHQVKR